MLCDSSSVAQRAPAVGRRAPRAGMLAAALVVGAVACIGLTGAVGAATPRPEVLVTPPAAALGAPPQISASGRAAGQSAVLRVVSMDANNIAWSSQAKFVADHDGVIDPARMAPTSGSYSGVQPMGLIDSMLPPPAQRSQVGGYQWRARRRAFV